MSRILRSLAMVVVIGCLATAVQAGMIGINFAADQPGDPGSDVNGTAGIHGIATWNNGKTEAGGPVDLVDDSNAASGATVSWASNNTWASTGLGEENNTAPDGNDKNLMTGYLDTTNTSVTTVTVEGLGQEFTSSGYNVIAYAVGGESTGHGIYSVGGQNKTITMTQPFDGVYILGENYTVLGPFTDSSFTLEATPDQGAGGTRAPLNGIEVFAVTGSILLGDVNLDGVVNGLDVDPFVSLVTSGDFQDEADMNEDGAVNGLDVDPFVAAVVGGGINAIPEPSTCALLLLGLASVRLWCRRQS